MMSHSVLVDGVGSNFETDTPVLTLTELWLYFCEKKSENPLGWDHVPKGCEECLCASLATFCCPAHLMLFADKMSGTNSSLFPVQNKNNMGVNKGRNYEDGSSSISRYFHRHCWLKVVNPPFTVEIELKISLSMKYNIVSSDFNAIVLLLMSEIFCKIQNFQNSEHRISYYLSGLGTNLEWRTW